jgi:hypothetical protein
VDRPLPGTLFKLRTVPKVSKLLDSARHYPCAHCNRQDGTIVAAHNNELALGRGHAHKTPDYLVAYLCSVCHDAVDGRSGGLKLEEKRALWNRAYVVTVSWWWRDGLIVVS